MRKSVMFFAVVLLCGGLPSGLWAVSVSAEEIREAGFQPMREGTAIVDFELADLTGVKRTLSGYRGKVVFLNFWATWCAPCRMEMPSMQKLYTLLRGRGLEIVAVNLQEDRKTVERFARELGLSFPILLDDSGRVGAAYGARSIPTTYIVDRQGMVVAGTIGTREWDTEEVVRFFTRLLE